MIMSRKNMIGAVLLAILAPQLLPAQQQQMTLHNVSGETFDVPLRKALPVDAPRVRYPGFKQETLILKAGTVRREGAMPLPCDILLERDIPIKLRDGVTIYTDVFRPVNEENCPAILAWSPYGKDPIIPPSCRPSSRPQPIGTATPLSIRPTATPKTRSAS